MTPPIRAAEFEEGAAMPSVRTWSGRALLSSFMLIGTAAMAQLPAAVPMAGTRLDLVVEGSSARVPDVAEIGAGVVTSRAHARTVVTEYGVAELFGRSLRERSAALIGIAHPDHRDRLRQEARAVGLD